MSRSPTRDLLVGVFVLLGIGALAYLSFRVGGLAGDGRGGLVLYAKFDQIAGLKARAPVEMSGVKVGQVTDIGLADDYRARVTMDLDGDLKLPVDTSASILTAGLLGDRYVLLQPGGETEMLRSGEEISFTESAVVLERLVGKLVHGGGEMGAGSETDKAEGK
jgi:phospholipid/cholesterol/gamma-HCH transport system substrate-binding protein